MQTDLLITIIGVLGTTWGAWLTYRGVVTRTRQDAQAENFTFMQNEIGRLRDDIHERDKLSREAFSEIRTLRGQILELHNDVAKLQRYLGMYHDGALVLYHQVLAEGLEPEFDPTKVTVPDGLHPSL